MGFSGFCAMSSAGFFSGTELSGGSTSPDEVGSSWQRTMRVTLISHSSAVVFRGESRFSGVRISFPGFGGSFNGSGGFPFGRTGWTEKDLAKQFDSSRVVEWW